MLKNCCLVAALLFAAAAQADTLQLKDKAAITGKVLAEKRDQVAVDVGYTVLVIPRSQIVKINKNETSDAVLKPVVSQKVVPAPEPASDNPEPAQTSGQFYTTAVKATPVRSVRELVSRLGEAVVQVRTPSGLGSGFIINEDGFLLTNFHVIEGETQISVEVYRQEPRITRWPSRFPRRSPTATSPSR